MKRILTVWTIQVVALVILAYFYDGLVLDRLITAVVAVGLIGLFNAFIRPFLIKITLPITLLTLGLFSLVINGLLIYLASEFLPGFHVASLGVAIWISIGMAILNTLISHLLSIDDSGVFYRNVVSKQAKSKIKKTKKPGIIFLEIDGLAKDVLARALRNGYMPTLARWLRESHALRGWECDLSSQTAASQAGILEGNNKNIPAFRWLDKATGKLYAASKPKDVAEMEKLASNKKGLLVGGISLNNMFSGDADESALTISRIAERPSLKSKTMTYYFLGPYNLIRTVSLAVVDIIRELLDYWYQKRNDIRPRVKRGFKFSLIRAATTIVARDLGVFTLIGYMFEGIPAVYTTFVGYDEVAHHAGIERSEAMRTLTQLDTQFARLEKIAKDTPRPYRFVVLSDHGQSQGATFKQRFGNTLQDVVEELLGEGKVHGVENTDEGWGHINTMITSASKEDSAGGKAIKSVAKGKTKKGVITIGPEGKVPDKTDKGSDVTVMASGNLGLVYFNKHKKRLTLEQTKKTYPGVVEGLAAHDGVGFVMIRSSKNGPVAIGGEGVHYLKSGKIDGEDPLSVFGQNTVRHLLREDKFTNVPDILVIGFYDPEVEEGAAFEELVGFHGGLGGSQSHPFLFHPKELKAKKSDIVGTDELHKILKSWVRRSL